MKGWQCASSLTAAVEDEKDAKPKREIYRGQRNKRKGRIPGIHGVNKDLDS